ncbi:MAG: AAA family ATPase [Candidatus Bathyarchaeota archaeon]|nr:AAA family ATPase [Candidatus Bathyarchaeota archaeon]
MNYLRPNISTGCSGLDKILDGGLPLRNVALLYGAAETGKTTLAIQCAANTARVGYKTIFIDSDNSFSPERLSQIALDDIDRVSASIIFIKPSSFTEQGVVIDHIEEYLTPKFGLVVVDTITSLYRAELGTAQKTFTLNRELNRQVASLAQIAKSHQLTVLMTSQVRSVPLPEGTDVVPVATRVLKFWSDFVIGLDSAEERGVIVATLEKPVERSSSCRLIMEEDGLHDHDR